MSKKTYGKTYRKTYNKTYGINDYRIKGGGIFIFNFLGEKQWAPLIKIIATHVHPS